MGTIDFSKYGIQKPATSTKPKVDFAKYGVSKPATTAPTQPEQPGIIQSIVQGVTNPFLRAGATMWDIGGKLRNIHDGTSNAALNAPHSYDMGYLGKVAPLGNTGGGIASDLKDGLGAGLSAASNLLPIGKVGAVAKATLAGRIGQGAWAGLKAGSASGLLAGTGSSLQDPNSSMLDVIMSGATGAAVGAGTGAVLGGAPAGLVAGTKTGVKLATPTGRQALKDAAFNDKLNKALPVLKKDVKTLPVKQTDARTALGDIVANKDKVGIIDPATGEAKLPSQYNFNETAQAQATRMKQIYADYSNQLKGVDKTKFDGEIHTSIFKQIDGLSKDLNVENSIDGRRALTKIRAELSSLRDTSPMGIQNYIESIGQRTRTAPGHPPTVEQIKLANVAGAMRKSLDEAVGKVDGPGYQELRNTYKAHKTIESQVLQAAKSELNKTPGWTDRLANIGMTAEGIQFMLTHDPQALAVAAGIKGTAKFMKWQRSPQRALSGMFKQLEQAQSSKPLTPSYMNQPASSVPNMTNIDASLPQSAKTSSLPNGNKMADYRNGVPNSEGGYTINPLARKQTKPVSVSLSNSISEPMKISVAKELENYDTTPLTVNGKPHFGNVEVEHRLAELKAKNARGTFTNADAIEAKALLKKVGIDLDKPVKKYGAK